jgi:crossover junction endodeoxyribonuclease RuvC
MSAVEDPPLRAVGIDLSLTATGIARSDGTCAVVGADKITTRCWDTRIRLLNGLAEEIVGTATIVSPRGAVIEGLDMAQSYGGQIERSYLWCEVVRRLIQYRILVWVVPSTVLKLYATGKGSGPKAAVIDAVARQWPWFNIGRNDNKADAAVCAALARAKMGVPFEVTISPARQLSALPKVLSVYRDPAPKARKAVRVKSAFDNSTLA